MPKKLCMRCGSDELDDARFPVAGAQPMLISLRAKKALGLIAEGALLNRAEICLACGFVNLFVDPREYRSSMKENRLTRQR